MKQIRRTLFAPSRTLLKFIVSGGSSAVLFFACDYVGLRLGLAPALANFAAYALAFCLGYLLQRTWTFEGRHSHGRALPRYFIVQAGCAIGTSVINHFAAPLLPVSPLVLSLAATLLAGVTSYVSSLLWVFPHVDAERPV